MLLNGLHDRHSGRVFVLQIGAGGGKTGLPLLPRFREGGWSGLLIEPHPDHFAALEALHVESERVAVLNLGVSDISATLALYALAPEALAGNPRLLHGRASLTRDRIAGPGRTDVMSVDVPVLRLDSVLRELGLDSAQLVVINAGGHEEQVLRSFDLAALSPGLVFVHAATGTVVETASLAALADAGLIPFRIGDWLAGLAPGALAVPLEELLSFFNKGIGQTADQKTDLPTDETETGVEE